jgi:hypothetical protein
MQKELPNNNVLNWKSKSGVSRIENLKQLLDILVNIKIEEIDDEISINVLKDNRLLVWLENNFSKEIGLISHLKAESKEYTPQQIRERLIRDLNKVT